MTKLRICVSRHSTLVILKPHLLFSFAVFMEDITFWVVASVFVFRMVFEENNGILRLFFIFALVAGMYAYFCLAGNRFSDWMAKWIQGILYPIGHFFKKVLKSVKKILKKCTRHLIMKTRGKLQ